MQGHGRRWTYNKTMAESIKADGWAPDATKAVEVAKRLISK